jgi:hypothetical protein
MTTQLRSVFWAFPQRLASDTRGVTLPLVAASITALIGFTGLAVETGFWYAIKRYNQSAADIGALSGAMEKAGGKTYPDICNLAELAAKANGFTFVSFTCPASSPACTSPATGQMCVNNPPALGAFTTNQTAVEVILAQQQSAIFASLSLPNVTIDTRAVAGLKSFASCMIALGTSGQDLKNNGTTTVNLNSCSFISNSTDPTKSVTFNGNVTMTAGAISTAGGAQVTGSSNYIAPPITTNAAAVSDPYVGQITVPTVPNGTYYTAAQVYTPGLYTAPSNSPAIGITASGTYTMCSGVYVLDGDDNQGRAFYIPSTGTTVNMGVPGNTYNGQQCPSLQNGATIPFGITIIAKCSSSNCAGGIVIGGTGASSQPTVNLAAPATSPLTGIPQEILFYQVASQADTKGTSTLAGGAATSVNGVVYTPASEIDLQGNPTFGSCTEFIAQNFVIGGTPTMNAPSGSCGINTQSASTLVLLE